MPPVFFAQKVKHEQSAAKPAARPLAGSMGATREAYLSNLAIIRDAKGGWPSFAEHCLALDKENGPFDSYPDGARMMDVMNRILALHGALMGDGAMKKIRAGEENVTGALHFAAQKALEPEFLVQSIFDWPARQWESLMENAKMCAGNPRLDEAFITYLKLVAESDGNLDYTAAITKCAKDPHNAKGREGMPEVLPLLPSGLEENPPAAIVSQAALLEDYKAGYTHYAAMVCNGKPVSIEAHPQNGYSTDGQAVRLPQSESSADTLERNERRMFCGLNHECWHIRYDSFRFVLELIASGLLEKLGAKLEIRPGKKQGKDGKPRDSVFLTRSQGKGLEKPKEIENLLQLLEMFPESHQAYVKDLLNIAEDGRIEFYGLNYFSGIRGEYEQDNADTLHRRPLIAKPEKGLAFQQVLEYLAQKAIAHATRNELTGNKIPLEIAAAAKEALELFLSVQQNGMRAEDSFNATMRAYIGLKGMIDEFVENCPDKRFIFRGWSTTPGGSPGTISIVSEPAEAEGVKRRRGIEGQHGPGKERKPKGPRASGMEGGDGMPPSAITDPKKKGESPVSTRSGTYPEWDANVNAYHKLFAKVNELEAQGAPIAPSPLLMRQFEDELLFLKPRGWVRLRRQRDGTFDVQQFHQQYLSFKATGRQMPGDFYTKMKKEVRSVAAALLVDGSGSTGAKLENGNSVLDEEIKAAVPFCHALGRIGDANALFVYNSSGQSDTKFYVCKDFCDEQIRGMQSEPANANRDGAAIRHAAKRLLERGEKTKVLIFFSDTQPADDEGYQHAYAIADTAMAIREAEQAGITVFGISISPYRGYMNQIYSANNFICIKSASEIPAHLSRIFRYLAR